MGGKTRAQFDSSEDLQIILTHLIQVLGEAARQVSPPFQEANAGIPWSKIIGMRNKVVHDYMSVDLDVVWGVATLELEPLLKKLEKLVT
ncbi:MAG: DUF86 domain-containing protein [bacterium]|nr:DUF86 domain-containing protein [bacterium]MDT8396367.1 HepT-like ribonuclease domain-containing protein [bacterium]